MAVGAGGLLAFLFSWILHSRVLRVLGLGAAVTGGALYAREKLAERAEKIEAAEGAVRSTLDDLDPVARAQVMMDIARHPDQ
jgi:uncharacterized membrane protein